MIYNNRDEGLKIRVTTLFYLYFTIKTSLGSNKPSPVTGLTVSSYSCMEFRKNCSGESVYHESCQFTPATDSLKGSLKGKLCSFIAFASTICTCFCIISIKDCTVNHVIMTKLFLRQSVFYIIFP